ncbi:uncharacterized protein LOC108102233 [Drosophila ficusphila]|uniref:uncharacterized protein LOC108102233 n=1 Tax=Drosophila ficusphila TaxID=30025 RepID=UPI001C89D2E4|nr:uncharacterized protein LOC108102233 [Drosophila ficusphila]XP_017062452.2 uncharacterized protein LOC108102233 [Drosophila ficusphila]XP_017062453.2 uncharacterized protein LOC108102233 [Drosophila ficusphila]XP_017062454.2 uncharacterized protein LOC108102233 [Drosophila ficusphila]XP_017062455.2 uncharacterized protein LOC108102233 [Drosophila ficusphila]XP_017062456.2 uncharacterized protein LOC108102233 [Drosophila ficusphila]XP_017062457.2 uncharacterized protein LOC108102233 [Drosop
MIANENNTGIRSIKITSYNIRGLKGKHNDKEFIEYLANFDIYILLETHTLPDAEAFREFESQQPDYEILPWKDATRELRYGRGVGGCVIAIRRSLVQFGITHTAVETNGFKILQLCFRREKVNIFPLYIHTNKWDTEFGPVKSAFEMREIPIENAIVLGDVNVRIGEIKQAVEPYPCVANTNGRRSTDKKIERGSKFHSFCLQNELTIVNGLTHGDSEGSYTYFSGRGNSTIDLAAVSRNLMPSIVDFKVDKPEVGPTRHGSDHLPICLEINLDFPRNRIARGSPSQNLVRFNSNILVTDATLDSAIKAEEVLFILRRASFPQLSRNALQDFLTEITIRCDRLFNRCDANQTIGSTILSLSDLKKILLNIVLKRIIMWCGKNRKISDFEIYTSTKSSKLDFVYNIYNLASIKLADKGKVYSYFVHFGSISPEIQRDLLWYKLQSLGVSSKIIKYLRDVYTQKHCEDELRDYFQNDRGILTALMMTLYLNDLPKDLKGGLVIDGRRIGILMHSGRIAIFSESAKELQGMIDHLEEYFRRWALVVDMERSKVMVFKQAGRIPASEQWFIEGKEIQTTSEVEIFGFILSPTLLAKKQVLKMVSEAKNNFENFRSTDESWIRLMEMHMAQIWGSEHFEEINALQKWFAKKKESGAKWNGTDLNTLARDLHLKYIGSVHFSRSESSLIHYLNLKVMERNVLWAEHLDEFCKPLRMKWKSFLNSEEEWNEFRLKVISRL